jgi:hypothetical protein
LISRTTALYDRAFVYAGRSLATLDSRFPAALAARPDELREVVAHLDHRAARPLLFAGIALASAADLDRGDLSRLVDLPRAIVLLERAHALDPGDFHAGAAMTLGLVYASPAMAGEQARSKAYFDEATARTGGKYLLIPGFMARSYAVVIGDRALFEKTLRQILATPDNVAPESRLPNLLARRRAARDLGRADTFFVNRGGKNRARTNRAATHRAGS